jgi:hypothetical protein
VRATEEVPAATDLGVLKEALERVGVGHRNVSGVAERALLLAGGTVLRFDLEGSYLGAATSDDAPATPAPTAEDGRETSPISPVYMGGDAEAGDTTALLPTRRGMARREEGSPRLRTARGCLERLAGLLPTT